MSNEKLETLKWKLTEVESADADYIDSNDYEILGEDEQGRDGYCTVKINEVAGEALSTIADQQSTIERLRGLLSIAACPNTDCIGGAIPRQVSEDEWEAEQCQWCDMRYHAVEQPKQSIPEEQDDGIDEELESYIGGLINDASGDATKLPEEQSE